MPFSSSRFRIVSLLVAACVLAGGLMTGTASAADTGRLHGVVRDHQDESPLAGATVQVVDGFGHVAATTKADSTGAYSIAVPAGVYEVVVIGGPAAHRYAARARNVTVGDDSDLDFSISRPVVFTGTVRDGFAAPLAGMVVGLVDPNVPYSSAGSATTGPDGSFAITAPSGAYTVAVSENLPDYGWLYALAAGLDLSVDRTQDLVFPATTTDTVVQSQDGSAIAGASVTLSSDDTCGISCPAPFHLFPSAPTDIQWSSRGTTGADGHVALRVLRDPNAVFAAYAPADAPGLGQVRRPGVLVPTSAALTAVLRPTVTFSGLLTGTDGTPLEGDVMLENGEYRSISKTEYSTTVGAFRVSVPPGRYRLHVGADVGGASVQDGMANRDPVPGAFVTVPDFDLTADRTQNLTVPTAAYTVRLLDHDGNPVTGTWPVGCSGGTATNCDVEGSDITGTAPVELFPGGTGTGVLRQNAPFFDDTRSLLIFPGSPPSLIGAVGTKVAGAVVVASDANGATLRLPPFVTISGTAADGWGPFGNDGPSGDLYVAMDADPSTDWGAQVWNGAYNLSTRPGHHTISIGDGDGYEEDDEATATLPEFWQLTSDIDVTGPTTVDFTVPDARTGAVRLVGPDGNSKGEGLYSVRGSTLAADVPMGGGRTGRGWVFDGSAPGADGFSHLLLFGESDLTGYFGNSVPVRLRLAPDQRLVVADAAPLPPATPGALTKLTTSSWPTIIRVDWVPPADNGGGPLLNYVVAASEGASTTFGSMVGPAATATGGIITGLRPGTTYTVIVAATNARGVGPATTLQVTTLPPDPAASAPSGDQNAVTATAPGSGQSGYWALGGDGHVFNFGDAPALGNAVAGAVDLEPTPTGKGYWILNRDGPVQPFGDAAALGNVDVTKLAKGEQPASLSATPTGKGYWIFTNRGRAVAFGDAPFLGDMSDTKLNGPVLGSVATPSGKGYYMVASDGGIFAFGDAAFAGSMGGKKLNAPVQSLVPDADGHGYWLVASDGGIFAFDAPFRGSMGGTRLNKPVVGMVRYGDGYLMVGADGGIFNFSSSPFAGSLGDKPPASPVVAVAALP